MKIDRLIGVLLVLLQEKKTTMPELAEKFEVSRPSRTRRRCRNRWKCGRGSAV